MMVFLWGCPVCSKYWRTSFIAVSVASDPPLRSLMVVSPSGVTLPSMSTYSTARVLVVRIGELNSSLPS